MSNDLDKLVALIMTGGHREVEPLRDADSEKQEVQMAGRLYASTSKAQVHEPITQQCGGSKSLHFK